MIRRHGVGRDFCDAPFPDLRGDDTCLFTVSRSVRISCMHSCMDDSSHNKEKVKTN